MGHHRGGAPQKRAAAPQKIDANLYLNTFIKKTLLCSCCQFSKEEKTDSLSSCSSCFVQTEEMSEVVGYSRNIRTGVMKLLRQTHRIHVTKGLDLKNHKLQPPAPTEKMSKFINSACNAEGR